LSCHTGAQQRTALQNAMAASARQPRQPVQPMQKPMSIPASLNSAGIPPRPSISRSMSGSRNNRPVAADDEYPDNQTQGRSGRPDPTYHSLSMSARPPVKNTGSGSTSYRQ
jgi:hypothetical protein